MEDKRVSKRAKDKILSIIEDQDYEAAEYVGDWKGYQVFAKTFVTPNSPMLGLPDYILVDGDNVKEAGFEECREIDKDLFNEEW